MIWTKQTVSEQKAEGAIREQKLVWTEWVKGNQQERWPLAKEHNCKQWRPQTTNSLQTPLNGTPVKQ